jgi:hypothetical protein
MPNKRILARSRCALRRKGEPSQLIRNTFGPLSVVYRSASLSAVRLLACPTVWYDVSSYQEVLYGADEDSHNA